MADNTKIEWTDATWNPITGCTIKSPGCTHCYAMKLAGTRLKHHPSRAGLTKDTKAGPVWTGEVRLNLPWLDQPIRWKRPRMIFVCAHGDLFAPGVQRPWLDQIWGTMQIARQHVLQVLTKRPEEMLEYLIASHMPVSPHIWLGCSVEDQARADERRESMRRLAEMGWLTWVSYEPALGPVDWTGWEFLRWMVSGGESDTDGKSARPSHPDWHRITEAWCDTHRIPFLFKQWGSWAPVYDRDRDDPDWRRCDAVARQTPNGRWINLVGGHGFHGDRVVRIDRVGKKAAGRLLDGREHNGFPTRERIAA